MRPESGTGATAKPALIAIAENDAALLAVLQEALEVDGHAVIPAKNGEQLQEIVRSEPVDLIVTDLRMPGCNGLTVISDHRSSGGTVPAILITAYADDLLRAEAHRFHVPVFDKPLGIRLLRNAVGHALAAANTRESSPTPAALRMGPDPQDLDLSGLRELARAGSDSRQWREAVIERIESVCHALENWEAGSGPSRAFHAVAARAPTRLSKLVSVVRERDRLHCDLEQLSTQSHYANAERVSRQLNLAVQALSRLASLDQELVDACGDTRSGESDTGERK